MRSSVAAAPIYLDFNASIPIAPEVAAATRRPVIRLARVSVLAVAKREETENGIRLLIGGHNRK